MEAEERFMEKQKKQAKKEGKLRDLRSLYGVVPKTVNPEKVKEERM